MIRLDDTVVVRTLTDTNSQLQILKAASDQKMGKSRVSLKDTVGQPLGSLFELTNRKLVLIEETVSSYVDNGAVVDPNSSVLGSAVLGKRALDSTLVRGDNSFYVDTNTAQKLTEPDICRLKESGLNGEEIIRTLIENSETFASKTDYAQEKWIKRKEMKYRKKMRIVKATPQSICEASFSKNKEKICNMRYDSLAQILSQSGISAGSRVMVVESTVGMVTGSVAYRMRGQGRIISIYGGQQPHLDMVKMYNLTAKDINIIQAVPSVELGPAAKDVCQLGFEAEAEEKEVEEVDEKGIEAEKEAPKSAAVTNLNATGRTKEEQTKVRSYLRRGVDSLIIACRYRPLPLLKLSLCLLHASSAFVVFHEFMEPLVECYLYLQQTAVALRIVLADTWLREFQTLPGRVRPDMFISTSGGYLLSGIYVGTVPCSFPRPHVNNYGSNSSSHQNGNADSQLADLEEDE